MTPDDESLHSFLLRQQLIREYPFDPVGVVEGNARWKRSPFAHDEVVYAFKSFNDDFLFDLIYRNDRLDESTFQLFSGPFSYSRDIYQTFHSRSSQCLEHTIKEYAGSRDYISSKAISDPIFFCYECIEDMLIEFGFAYFKDSWSSDRWCWKHSKPLEYIVADGYAESLRLIEALLAGKKISCKPLLNQLPKEVCLDSDGTDFFSRSDLFYPVRCLEDSAVVIAKFLFNFASGEDELFISCAPSLSREKLLGNFSQVIDGGCKDRSESEDAKYRDAEYALGRLLSDLQDFSPLTCFIKDHFEFLHVCGGPRRQLSEIIMAPKPDILKVYTGRSPHSLYHLATQIDVPDFSVLVKHSTSLKRLLIQQQGVVPLTGSQVWSPVRVLSHEDIKLYQSPPQIDLPAKEISVRRSRSDYVQIEEEEVELVDVSSRWL